MSTPRLTASPNPPLPGEKITLYLLQEDQRISISAAGNLYIGNMDIADLALYQSTVQNTVTGGHFNRGPISINFAVRDAVTTPSEIILGPINQVAIDGQTSSVTFECFGSGRPMPTLSWTKNGQAICSSSKLSFDQYKKRLTVHNPNKADEGDYECHANSRKRTANLTAIVQPTFTVQPTNVDKLPQDTAIFACNASGIPQPTITWFHNGAKVSPSPTGRIRINGKKELKFTSLQSGDAGTVQCIATNYAGEAIITAMLNVRPLDVWIDVPPKDTTALVNETVELECKGRGSPTPAISWKKNDVAINFANNGRYLKMSTGSLRISLSQKSDSGEYTCMATNSHGSKWANASLSVLNSTSRHMEQ